MYYQMTTNKYTYVQHNMEIISFEDNCVFADLEVSGGPEGGTVVNSVNPNTADQ